jgi:hypothetical protein
MSKVDLIATKAMRYGGRALTAGEPFQASRRDARTLSAIRKAEPAPEVDPEEIRRQELLDRLRGDYQTAAGEPADLRWGAPRLEQEIAAAVKAKAQTYQRRDLRAED